MSTSKRLQTHPYLTCTEFNSKWNKNLNLRTDTLNLTEQKVGNSLELISTRKDLITKDTLVHALKPIINKGDLVKLKSSCMAKDTIIRAKWQLTK